MKNINITEINNENLNQYCNLAHAYEAEFSALTGNLPDRHGIFQPDTMPNDDYTGFLLYDEGLPCGFAVVNLNTSVHDVAEFYVVPVKRLKKLGTLLAHYLFQRFPGKWQVRQISGADHATQFWRRVIAQIQHSNFQEAVVDDPEWGQVTRQCFSTFAPLL